MRRLKARNRPHGTHTHGGTSGINGHMGTSGGKPKALSAARNGNWELGGGSRMGMGWDGRGGEGRSPKAPPLSSSNPNSLPLPLPPRRRRRRRQQHFTSLHFTSLPTYRLLLGPGLGLLHRAGGLRGLRLHLLHFVGRWDAMVDGMGWDGMLWDGMGWDGMGEKSIECRGEEESKRRSKSAPGPRARDPDRG